MNEGSIYDSAFSIIKLASHQQYERILLRAVRLDLLLFFQSKSSTFGWRILGKTLSKKNRH